LRPERDDLEEKNILKGTDVAPSLQAARAALEKEQLADSLGHKLAERPDVAELHEKHIIEGEAEAAAEHEAEAAAEHEAAADE